MSKREIAGIEEIRVHLRDGLVLQFDRLFEQV
jgi:hypothetical protein